MVYTALTVVKEKHIAEDIASDFLQFILANANSLTNISNPQAWIITCIKNRAKDYIKANNRSVAIDYLSEVAASIDTAHQATLHYEITSAFLGLTDYQKELFVLRYVYGYKYKEIAQFTATSIGTIKSQLFEIRVQLSHLKKFL